MGILVYSFGFLGIQLSKDHLFQDYCARISSLAFEQCVVTDDTINEADEVFVVLLEFVDAVDPNRVDLSFRNASLCRIGDNDRKLETVLMQCSDITFH